MSSEGSIESFEEDDERKTKKVCLPGDITSDEATMSAFETNVTISRISIKNITFLFYDT